jgi:hypothetical protein
MSQTNEAIRDAYRPVRPGFFATLRETAEEIATRRRLILYLVRADLKKRGADTVLGNVWWILDPLLTLLVYVILIAVIFRTQIDAYPVVLRSCLEVVLEQRRRRGDLHHDPRADHQASQRSSCHGGGDRQVPASSG